ncbi:MAG: VOC family protein [Nitratireductor sp.]|nr:VOC family protein [Nitratireductor sp.]
MHGSNQAVIHVALVVRDYDEALAFYCGKLGFELIEDSYQPEQDKRWVVIAPRGFGESGQGTTLLLARASKPKQLDFIGNQSGGRVFLFLRTNDFDADYRNLLEQGITIIREPKQMDYGKVAVFADLYGNQWDLIEFASGHRLAR